MGILITNSWNVLHTAFVCRLFPGTSQFYLSLTLNRDIVSTNLEPCTYGSSRNWTGIRVKYTVRHEHMNDVFSCKPLDEWKRKTASETNKNIWNIFLIFSFLLRKEKFCWFISLEILTTVVVIALQWKHIQVSRSKQLLRNGKARSSVNLN